MVDPTKGIGPMRGLISGTRVSEPATTKRTSDVKDTSGPKDEVNISQEALNLSEAKEAYTKVRSLLEQDTSQTLSAGGSFDESL